MTKAKQISKDELELIHCHIRSISDIVGKLEAYQAGVVDHSEGEVSSFIRDTSESLSGYNDRIRHWIYANVDWR